jgi:hypothetical protein
VLQRVAVGAGLDWIAGGWDYWRRMAGPATLLTALLLVITLLATSFGSLRIGSVLLSTMAVFYLAIVAQWCSKLDDQAALAPLRDLRALFRNAQLWCLAASAGAVTLGRDLLSNTMAVYAHAASWTHLGLYFLLVNLLALLAVMALWLAPALVVQDGRSFLPALKLSLLSTLRHFLPCLLFSLLAFVLCIVAAIPLGLGLLAAMPTLACAAFLAARELFAA